MQKRAAFSLNFVVKNDPLPRQARDWCKRKENLKKRGGVSFTQACIDSYYPSVHPVAECNAGSDGTFLPANTRYTIQFWARSDPPGMAVEALTGSWAANEAAHEGFHQVGTYVRNETVAGATLNNSWQLIRGVLPVRATGRFLQLQLQNGSGSLYIDNTFIGANMTEHEERELARLV